MVFQIKFAFVLLAVLCYTSFVLVCGKPNLGAEGEIEPLNAAVHDDGARFNTLTRKARRCFYDRYGCYKGYCWAGCKATTIFSEGMEWCYTTKTYSQSFEYIPCTNDKECDACWSCAGSCTV